MYFFYRFMHKLFPHKYMIKLFIFHYLLNNCFLANNPYSLEEVTGHLALEVTQWFIAVLISPDPTFYKTKGCDAGTLEPYEKSKMAHSWPSKRQKNTKLNKTPLFS